MWGIVSVLFLLLLATMWTAWSRVVVDDRGVQVTRSWLFIDSHQQLVANDIKKVEPKFSMSAGTTSYYDLLAITNGGKKVKLASSIKGKKESEWLAREIQNALSRK